MASREGVEDPISALFDLAERAAGMAPVVRRLYRYTAVILVLWIVIMAILILVGLGSAGWLSVLALIGLGAGVIALGLLRQTDRFFREFVERHQWIRQVREADPDVRIPEGRTPIERLARYLALSNPRIERRVAETPAAVRYRVSVRAGGREIPFDLIIESPSGAVARWFGGDDSGFAVVARLASGTPTLAEVRQLEADALTAAPVLAGRLARVILLRVPSGELPEEVYDYAVGHPVEVPWGFGRRRAALEIISERPDGSYDLVPRVLSVP